MRNLMELLQYNYDDIWDHNHRHQYTNANYRNDFHCEFFKFVSRELVFFFKWASTKRNKTKTGENEIKDDRWVNNWFIVIQIKSLFCLKKSVNPRYCGSETFVRLFTPKFCGVCKNEIGRTFVLGKSVDNVSNSSENDRKFVEIITSVKRNMPFDKSISSVVDIGHNAHRLSHTHTL